MYKTRFECRQVILKNWTQMTPGSETLTNLLEGTARYAGLLLAPVEGFGLRPMLYWPSAKTFYLFFFFFLSLIFFKSQYFLRKNKYPGQIQ